MSKSGSSERRGNIRYPSVVYRAEVKRLRGLTRFKQPADAELIDYHSAGAGFFSAQRFEVGDRVMLSIFSATEQVSDIRGVVRYVRCRRNGYWFGIEFTDQVKGKSVDQSVLVGLEQLMKARFS